jgi:hypothetical protein
MKQFVEDELEFVLERKPPDRNYERKAEGEVESRHTL